MTAAVLVPPEERGRTEIAGQVVEQIVLRAVAECGHARGPARQVLGIALPVGGKAPRVDVSVDGQLVTVAVRMAVTYPAPVRRAARQVRDHVMTQVAALTGLQVRHVDVDIDRLVTPERGQGRVQ